MATTTLADEITPANSLVNSDRLPLCRGDSWEVILVEDLLDSLFILKDSLSLSGIVKIGSGGVYTGARNTIGLQLDTVVSSQGVELLSSASGNGSGGRFRATADGLLVDTRNNATTFTNSALFPLAGGLKLPRGVLNLQVADSEGGRTLARITPDAVTDAGSIPFNISAGSFANGGGGSFAQNYVVEMGHGNSSGGGGSGTIGYFRDAWEQSWYSEPPVDETWGERHIAWVPKNGVGSGEVRCFSASCNVLGAAPNTLISGAIIHVMDHVGGQVLKYDYNSGTPYFYHYAPTTFFQNVVVDTNKLITLSGTGYVSCPFLRVGGADLAAAANLFRNSSGVTCAIINNNIEDTGTVLSVGFGNTNRAQIFPINISGSTSGVLDLYQQQNGNGLNRIHLNSVGTGDPMLFMQKNGVQGWVVGYDISAGAFKISSDYGALGDASKEHLVVTNAGYVTLATAAGRLNFFGGTPRVQQAAIANATEDLADVVAKFNTLLGYLRPTAGYGLIAA